MSQPKWVLLHSLGDIGNIYADETGVYPPAAEIAEEIQGEDFENDTPAVFELYRVPLEKCELHNGVLGSLDYKGVFHREWFEDDCHTIVTCEEREGYCAACGFYVSHNLTSAARTCDTTVEELRKGFTSDDALERFNAYYVVAGYHGWHNFDSYPLTLTEPELDKRWTEKS